MRGWEVYRTGRQFVITGRTVCGYGLQEAQRGIDMVLAEHFTVPEPNGPQEARERLWEGVWRMDGSGRLPRYPAYPRVAEGGRHIALVSFCGQRWSHGAGPGALLGMARTANRWLDPPLPDEEVRQVARSVTRYRR